MAEPKKTEPKQVEVKILRDGVFIADDVRADEGDKVKVEAGMAADLEKAGLAKRV